MKTARPIVTLAYKKDEITFYEDDKDNLDCIFTDFYFLLSDLAKLSGRNIKNLVEIIPSEQMIRRYFSLPNEPQKSGWFVKKEGFDLCFSLHRPRFKDEILKEFEEFHRRCRDSQKRHTQLHTQRHSRRDRPTLSRLLHARL